jgi:hypothetical protein
MAMSLETRPKAENISRPKNRLTHAGSHQRHVTCERQMALPIFWLSVERAAAAYFAANCDCKQCV